MSENRRTILSIGLRFLAASLVASGACGISHARSLFPNPAFQVGSNPSKTVMADLNGDGLMDLVVVDNGYDLVVDRGGVSVLLGRSDGTFSGQLFFGTSGKPFTAQTADFNDDGKPDLVVGISDSNSLQPYISIFLGHGDATFGPEQHLASSAPASLIQVGDFNGDHEKDIVALVQGADGTLYLQVFLGGGNGSFTPTVPFATAGYNSVALSVADLNRDGLDDLAAPAAQGSAVVIFTSRGDGTFDTRTLATPAPAYTARAADFNADGIDDLAVGCLISQYSATPWSLFVFLGRGDGTFASTPSAVLESYFQVAATADLNGDARIDLLAFSPAGPATFLGRGDGTFEPGRPTPPASPDSPVFADFDRDGRVDLTGSKGESNAVFLFYGNGDGTFGPPPLPILAGFTSTSVTHGDFNFDGIVDVAVADNITGQVEVIPGLGDGTFGPASGFQVPFTPTGITAADLNGDAHDDLVVVGIDQPDPSTPPPLGLAAVFLGRGDGTFVSGAVYPVGYFPRPIKILDLNGDLLPDLVVVDEGSSQRDWNLPGGISVLLAHGDGTFSSSPVIPVGEQPSSVAAGDFDRDGRMDLAVTDYGDFYLGIAADLSLLPGNGDGTFHSPTVLALGVGLASVASGDLDGDGNLDLAVADTGNYDPLLDRGHISVFLGKGNGSFRAGARFQAGLAPFDLIMDDLDGDSRQDLAVASNAYLSFFPGAGDGSFGPETPFGLLGALTLVVDDFNSDHLGDVLAISPSGSILFVNQGTVPQRAVDLTVSTENAIGGGAAVVNWRTTAEIDLTGFNIVVLNPSGATTQLNAVLIPCEECITGLGHQYSAIVPKHKNARSIYVEVVHRDGRVERFGPATKL